LREFFDPVFWKGSLAQLPSAGYRWTAAHLLYTAIALALSYEPTQKDRFQAARQFAAAFFDKRRRPGKTYTGFTDAWQRQGLAVGVLARRRLQEVLLPHFRGWASQAYALDGSRVLLPHSAANAAAYGETRIKNRTESAPQLLVVAAVQVSSQALYDWELAGGNGSEPALAARIIQRLPPGALVIKDSGTVGYKWLRDLLAGGRHILMRVAGNFKVWAEDVGQVRRRGGKVWVWPKDGKAQPPLKLRLIAVRVTGRRKGRRGQRRKAQVSYIYLLTDLSRKQLSDREAGRLYRGRWGANEIGFRKWKQTLEARKLTARVPELAELECFYSLLALQVLQALQLVASRGRCAPGSVAQVWRVWREAVERLIQRRSTAGFAGRLKRCVLDSYKRRRPKQRRRPPRDKSPVSLGPPQIRRLTKATKRLWRERFQWAS
jgi:hypothetical protein